MLIFDSSLNDVLFSGLGVDSLGRDGLAGLIGFSLKLVVFLNSSKEVKSGGRLSEMLESNVDSLFDDSISNFLVDDNTDSSGVNVEDSTSSSVIVLVGHTLMDGTIDDNINVITNVVVGQLS